MKKVLVIGGAGLTGRAIAQLCLANDFEVVTVDRREQADIVRDDVDIFNPDFMGALVESCNPFAIFDCVNIASVTSRKGNHAELLSKYVFDVIKPITEKGIVWVDIGTVGSGGMGINIPWTHNEPTLDGTIAPGLIKKVMAAGCHGSLLDLLGRTPGYWVGRVVPRAMIGFENPFFDRVHVAHLKFDPVKVLNPYPLKYSVDGLSVEGAYTFETEELKGVAVRAGENGHFGLIESEAITAIGQMEMVTDDAVAEAALAVLYRLMSQSNGGTYQEIALHPDLTSHSVRNYVLESMRELSDIKGVPSIAFGNLGPYVTTELWSFCAAIDYVSTEQVVAFCPGLGIPVLTDEYFYPAYTGKSHLTPEEVNSQFDRFNKPAEKRLWGVDLTGQNLVKWDDLVGAIYSNPQGVSPGEIYAQIKTNQGHGRSPYSRGIEHGRF